MPSSSANNKTRRSAEAFSLDQLTHSLVPAGTQLAFDRTGVRGLDALFDKKPSLRNMDLVEAENDDLDASSAMREDPWGTR